MIPETSPIRNIFTHGMEVEKLVVEIDEVTLKAGSTIYPGQPVVLDTTALNGYVKLVITDVKVLGLAKSNQNTYATEATGEIGGIYGSNKMSVVCKGIVNIGHSYFRALDGSIVTVKGYDDTATTGILSTTNPMTALGITNTGLLTVAASAGSGGIYLATNTNCKVGYLLKAPTATDPRIQVYLDC